MCNSTLIGIICVLLVYLSIVFIADVVIKPTTTKPKEPKNPYFKKPSEPNEIKPTTDNVDYCKMFDEALKDLEEGEVVEEDLGRIYKVDLHRLYLTDGTLIEEDLNDLNLDREHEIGHPNPIVKYPIEIDNWTIKFKGTIYNKDQVTKVEVINKVEVQVVRLTTINTKRKRVEQEDKEELVDRASSMEWDIESMKLRVKWRAQSRKGKYIYRLKKQVDSPSEVV